MNAKSQKILESLKDKRVGVFCDDSNLYYSYKKYGWRVDFAKLKQLLEESCDLQFINYYIAIPRKSDEDYRAVQRFIQHIDNFVILKKKPLKYIPVKSGFARKGDVDVEIVLDVVRKIDELDTVVVMSGDSDFLELKNYVVKEKHKELIFFGYEENMAWELRQCWHLYLNKIRQEVSLQ